MRRKRAGGLEVRDTMSRTGRRIPPAPKKMDNTLKITEHKKFWNHEKTIIPLASFRIGSYFIATQYMAAQKLLAKGKIITPEMIDVDSFMEDYEMKFREVSALDQSAFWTAEPYAGIPWMEAFWGCQIIGSGESFAALPFAGNPQELQKLEFKPDNRWVAKYFEFIEKLNKLSAGRFPVGAPILRGQGDTIGALTGQTEFIYALYEEPLIIRKTLDKIVDSFLFIYEQMHRMNIPFLGGSSMGFYHIWAPGKSLWFQDDMGALLSPTLYRDFFLENERRICKHYDYNMVHLHSSAFHLLDDILDNEYLKAVEINKDAGGPGITQMLEQFKKVLDKNRRLVVWGNLNEDEIQFLIEKLGAGSMPAGLFFNILHPDLTRAVKINSFLKRISK